MAAERQDKTWLRLHIPNQLHERLKERKKVRQMRSMHDLAVEAIANGLEVKSGSRMMIRDLEDGDFVELNDYFKDSKELTFVGKDLAFFLDRYSQFLNNKMEDRGRLRFIVDGEANAEKVRQEFSSEQVKVLPLLNENTSPVNIVFEGFNSKMVVWFNLGTLRSPFFYFDDSSSQPASKFMQYYLDVIVGLI